MLSFHNGDCKWMWYSLIVFLSFWVSACVVTDHLIDNLPAAVIARPVNL